MSITWVGVAFVNKDKLVEERNQNSLLNLQNTKCLCSGIKEKLILCYLSSKQYIHCELAFPIRGKIDKVDTYGVTEIKGVFNEKRTFQSEYYQWLCLEITQDEATKIKNFCKEQVGKQWDGFSAMISVLFPVVNKKKNDNWWCASFVVAALQQIGILSYSNCYAFDIDDIYYQLFRSRRLTITYTPAIKKSVNKIDLYDVDGRKYEKK